MVEATARALRHPGPVPGSMAPHTRRLMGMRLRGCRDDPGMTKDVFSKISITSGATVQITSIRLWPHRAEWEASVARCLAPFPGESEGFCCPAPSEAAGIPFCCPVGSDRALAL